MLVGGGVRFPCDSHGLEGTMEGDGSWTYCLPSLREW